MEYIEDALRSGQPKVVTEEKKEELLKQVRKHQDNREKSSDELGWLVGLPRRTAYWILQEAKLEK